ncbi:MAG: FAD:protein FMN transferase [Luteitalea sp.]|nr:FAD:protein FMN transferase [Luteitalea sp.]
MRVNVSRRTWLTGAAPTRKVEGRWLHVHRTAMACRFEITIPQEAPRAVEHARAALDLVTRLEAQLTVFRSTSEVSALNRDAAEQPVAVEAGLFALLARCQALYAETDRAFDPTAGPLTRCWGFFERDGRVPDADALNATMARVGMQHVSLDRDQRTVRFLRPGVELNFGAIGKGYTLDLAIRLLQRRGVDAALASAGGSSVAALGRPSGLPGWIVSLRHPAQVQGSGARVVLCDAHLATSGDREQWFTAGGKRYGHVLDPRTGMPVEGIRRVSVVASSGADADALATAFFVSGVELARHYCATHPDVAALFYEEHADRPLLVGSHPRCRFEVLDA